MSAIREFTWVSPRKLAMKKRLFSEHEINLANCLNLEVDIENMVVYADLPIVAKQALFEFIKEAFRAFSHNLDNEQYRNTFYSELTSKYDEIYSESYDFLRGKLPYWDKLFEHQKHGLGTILYKQHNFLSWSMRTGKTVVAASIARSLNIKRTLIICPATIKYAWFRQLTEDWGYNPLYFTIMDAAKSKTLKAFQERFLIINYDVLHKYADEILKEPIGLIIADEVHRCKDTGSRRHKALRKIIDGNPDARTIFLSGSPVRSRCNDFFAYLRLTHHPLGSSYTKFIREYTETTSGRYGLKVGRARNITDLWRKTSNYMIRRRAEDCIDIPDVGIYKYRFELNDYKEEYLAIIKEMAKEKDVSYLKSNITSLNRVNAKSKIKGIIDVAEMIIEQDRKIIIFSGYTEPIDMLVAHFKDRCVFIDGRIPSTQRDPIIQRFWNDPNIVAFIGNRIACGEGLDMSNADDVLHTDLPFIPGELDQANARVLKHGKKRKISTHYFFTEESIDDHLFELIAEKAEDIDALVDRGKPRTDMTSIPEVLYSKIVENYRKENPEIIEKEEIV